MGEVDWEKLIFEEIANPKMRRAQVAQTYRYLINTKLQTAGWSRINQAIMERWSTSALIWIKQQAWRGMRNFTEQPF